MTPGDGPLAAVTRRSVLAGGLAWVLLGRPAVADVIDVDLELVLAVDASGSVSQQRFILQKQGYERAFRDPRVLRAVRSGVTARIAVSMFQWTGPHMQAEVTPWMLVSDETSAAALATAIAGVPRKLYGGGTSISGAIDHALGRFGQGTYKGARRVIDISGDGANTSGRPVAQARDEALGQAASKTVGTLERAEQMSIQALKGDADTRQVVDAVMDAQQALQPSIAIRDKIVTAYLEISRMAI